MLLLVSMSPIVSSLPGVKLYRDRNFTVTRIEGKLERGDPRNFIGWKWLDFPISELVRARLEVLTWPQPDGSGLIIPVLGEAR